MSVCTPKSFDLTGKVALITGASYGIGMAIAKAMAANGATIVFNDIKQELVDKGLASYAEAGIKAHGYVCDVTDEDAVNAMVAKITEEVGHINILVNNAGVSQSTKLEDYQPEDFAGIMNLNVNALFNAIQPAVKIMRAQGGGVILNTSSMVSISGQPSGVGYPTSKFAVNGMTLSLARELGPSNIRVNGVAPGVTRTDMVAALPENMIKPLIATIPLRRVGEPEDIANAFHFLASDMASYITGEILSVDGAARS